MLASRFGRFALPTFKPRRLVALPIVALDVGIALACAAPAANAQAQFSFTGGSNSPLTLSLLNTVSYTITAPTPIGFFFVFDAVNLTNTNPYNVSGSLTYRINNGSAQTITVLRERFNINDVTSDDMALYSSGTLAAGDVVTLFSGSLTTTTNYTTARPANGTFSTFMTRDNANRISANGVAAAPEPGSLTLLGMGLAGGAGMVGTVRRRKAK